MGQRALDKGLDKDKARVKVETPFGVAVATPDEAVRERRWPIRRRFLFIVSAATLCWAVPLLVLYLLVR